jgi:SnoaL-like domain
MRSADHRSGRQLGSDAVATVQEGRPMDSWELIAREQIRELVTRYNSNGDTGRFGDVLDQFAPDAVMEFEGRTYRGRGEIETIFTGTSERTEHGGSREYLRHMTSTHQIDLIDESHAGGRCYFQVLTSTGLDHWGRYLDEFRVVDDRWRISHRRVVVDGISRTSIFSTDD